MDYFNLYYKEETVGRFFPQYQLIWIKERRKEESLEHEFFHAYTSFLYPPHLFTFYNCLCDLARQPHAQVGIDNFRDIVEASVLVWQKVTGKISNLEKSKAKPEYIYLAQDMIALKDELNSLIQKENSLELETFHGLLMFFLHIVPHDVNCGQKIVGILRNNLPDINWYNRFELFFKLYFSYNKLVKEEDSVARWFKLDYPLDYHRIVGDIFVFLRVALWILLSKYREDLLPFIISFINLFSIGGLVILPIVYVDEENKKMKIEIVHSTNKSINIAENAISIARTRLKFITEQKHTCFATQLFEQILHETTSFVVSTNKNRGSNFIEHFLKLIEDKFYSMNIEKCDCLACKNTYNSVVYPYKEIFIEGFKNTKDAFLEYSQKYEPWFFSNCGIEWLASLLGTSFNNYEVVFEYDYL